MAEINMNKVIIANELSKEDINEEVIEYVSRVSNIAEMDEQFWSDFILGASLYGITAGYNGAI